MERFADMDTDKTKEEVEVMLASSRNLGFYNGFITFNVIGIGEKLKIGHECDMLVLNRNNYLTEIEIKRSYADFLNDFKKPHRKKPKDDGIIKHLYYAVPNKVVDKCMDKITKDNVKAGLISYSDDCWCFVCIKPPILSHRSLTIDERLELGRLASLKAIALKRKIIRLTNQLNK